MSTSLFKRMSKRLGNNDYEQLRRRVLRRDGWRCQRCGRTDQLEVHHLHYRSRGGRDVDDNLIVLCQDCHQLTHARAPGVF